MKHLLVASTAALSLTAALSAPAFAQDADGDVIVVTGSVIRGTPEDAALPVDVIGGDELRALGNPQPVELLKQLSVTAGTIGDSNQFDGRAQATEGQASVNLRGLGAGRTLVLLNNQRVATQGDFVDINLLPQAAIGRVEILKDGAAATYGSDAIGGVVNFITRTDQDGLRFTGNYQHIDDTDGDFDLGLSYGFQGSKFEAFVAAGFQNRAELLTRDREFAIQPYNANPAGGYTGGGNPGSFIPYRLNGTISSSVPAPFLAASAAFGLVPDGDCVSTGGVLRADSALPARCRTLFTPFGALVEKDRRGQLWADFTYYLNDDWDLRVTGLYGTGRIPHYRSSPSYILTQAPTNNGTAFTSIEQGLSLPDGTLGALATGFNGAGFIVPSTSPAYQAYQAQFAGTPNAIPADAGFLLLPGLFNRPFMNSGNPLFQGDSQFNNAGDDIGTQQGVRETESIRLSGTLEGQLTDNIDFQANVVWNEYDRMFSGWDTFVDRYQAALAGFGGPSCDPATGTAGVGDCSYFNPFGLAYTTNTGTGAVNADGGVLPNDDLDLIRWFFVPTRSDETQTLFVVDGTFSGSTGFELPGGEILFGAGGQYRRTEFENTYGINDNLANTPCRDTPTTGNTVCDPSVGALAFLGTNSDVSGEIDVYAFFGELILPVTDDLNVQLAARFEDYGGDTGNTFDPKATVRWQATDMFALRGSVGTTFRGPGPEDVSAGQVTVLQNIRNSFRPVDITGNPAVAPESALNYSAGLLFDFGDLSGSIDYWRFEIEDQLVTEPFNAIVDAVFPTDGSPDNCTDPAFAGLVDRLTFSGSCSVANLSRVQTGLINGPELTVEGIDFIMNYDLPMEVAGGFMSAGVNATYNLAYEQEELTVEGIVVQQAFDAVGNLNFGSTAFPLPDVKGSAFLTWSNDFMDARLNVRYIDDYIDERAALGVGPFSAAAQAGVVASGGSTAYVNELQEIEAQVMADLNFSFQLPAETILTATVINITDEDPAQAALELNYDPFTGFPLGRTFKIGIQKDF